MITERQKIIVLVDDEESIHLLYSEEIEELFGDQVTLVQFLCAEDALEYFKSSRPDLIISCIHMPGMNGIDFLKECKKIYPEVPFIINSAHQGFEDDLPTWPCDAYVVKSSNLTELFNQIRRLLSLQEKTEHTLCQKLNLRVNDYPISLNEALKQNELQNHGIKKIGFLSRILLIKLAKNETVYWAKNPRLDYINDEYKNTIIPILHKKIGVDMMCGTSAYLWFKNIKLHKFVFQIIGNETVARMQLELIETKIAAILGPATPINKFTKQWSLTSQKIILEFPTPKKPHGYIFLHLENKKNIGARS